ncbi:hypothetical protein BY996DRAFT_7766317 [Phakopsora pachyrhizi]|nr:hypothetical protein BY996DRAFT_7766317 [Phakopsora pachyrhizi]
MSTRRTSSRVKRPITSYYDRDQSEGEEKELEQRQEIEDESETDGEEGFSLDDLTRPQVLKLNRAFDRFSNKIFNESERSNRPTKHKERRASFENDENCGGGFINDDVDDRGESENGEGGGGFVIEEDSVSKRQNESGGGFIVDEPMRTNSTEYPEKGKENNDRNSYIRLDRVSNALDMLGLPSDNLEIIQIFEEAASTAEEEEESDDKQDVDDERFLNDRFKEKSKRRRGKKIKGVNRKRFLKVCGTLMSSLGSEDDEEGEDNDWTFSKGKRKDRDSSSKAKRSRRISNGSDSDYNYSKDSSIDSLGDVNRRISTTKDLKTKPNSSSIKNRKKRLSGTTDHLEEDDDEDDEVLYQTKAIEIFDLFFQSDFKYNRALSLNQKGDNDNKSIRNWDRKVGFDEIKSVSNQLGENYTDEEVEFVTLF